MGNNVFRRLKERYDRGGMGGNSGGSGYGGYGSGKLVNSSSSDRINALVTSLPSPRPTLTSPTALSSSSSQSYAESPYGNGRIMPTSFDDYSSQAWRTPPLDTSAPVISVVIGPVTPAAAVSGTSGPSTPAASGHHHLTVPMSPTSSSPVASSPPPSGTSPRSSPLGSPPSRKFRWLSGMKSESPTVSTSSSSAVAALGLSSPIALGVMTPVIAPVKDKSHRRSLTTVLKDKLSARGSSKTEERTWMPTSAELQLDEKGLHEVFDYFADKNGWICSREMRALLNELLEYCIAIEKMLLKQACDNNDTIAAELARHTLIRLNAIQASPRLIDMWVTDMTTAMDTNKYGKLERAEFVASFNWQLRL